MRDRWPVYCEHVHIISNHPATQCSAPWEYVVIFLITQMDMEASDDPVICQFAVGCLLTFPIPHRNKKTNELDICQI